MKTLRRKRTHRRHVFGDFDILEPRLALTFAVTAALSPQGDLVINGDDQKNEVSVTFEDDDVVVSTEEGAIRIALSQFSGKLKVDLKGGDDVFRLGGDTHDAHDSSSSLTQVEEDHDHDSGALVLGGIYVNMGSGSDSVRLTSVETPGDLIINTTGDQLTENDNDRINIGRGPGFEEEGHHAGEVMASTAAMSAASVTVNSTNDTGCGDDEGPRVDVMVGGQMRLTTGDGDDSVRIAFTSLGGDLRVKTGAGDDLLVTGRGPIGNRHGGGHDTGGGHEAGATLLATSSTHDDDGHAGGHAGGRPVDVHVAGDVNIDTGPDDDFVMLKNLRVQQRLDVTTSSGDDALGSQNLIVHAPATLVTGPGLDVVALWQSNFWSMTSLNMGPGNDVALFDRVFADADFFAEMSSHDDVLVIVKSQFAASVELSGGTGNDQLFVKDTPTVLVEGLDASSKNGRWEEVSSDDLETIDGVMSSARDLFGPYMQGN